MTDTKIGLERVRRAAGPAAARLPIRTTLPAEAAIEAEAKLVPQFGEVGAKRVIPSTPKKTVFN
jgi:hypothetical protein